MEDSRTVGEIVDRIVADLLVYSHQSMRTIGNVALRVGATRDKIIWAGAMSDKIIVRDDIDYVGLA